GQRLPEDQERRGHVGPARARGRVRARGDPRSRRAQHRAEALVRPAMMILDERAVHDLLSMEELILAMAKAMADLSSGKVAQPGRVMLPVADHQGFLGLMPAYGGA